jgi:hypothetical protein
MTSHGTNIRRREPASINLGDLVMDTIYIRISLAQLDEVLMALESNDASEIVDLRKEEVVLRPVEAILCAEWGVEGFSLRKNTGYCQFRLADVTRYIIEVKVPDDFTYVAKISINEGDEHYELVSFMQPIGDPYVDYYNACWIRFSDTILYREEWEEAQKAKAARI